MRFKIGDKVKISKECSHLSGWRKEFEYAIFTIIELGEERCLLNIKRYVGKNSYILYKRLELIKPGTQLEFDFMKDT